VPEKILTLLPFATLKNPTTGHYLVEDRIIEIVDSNTSTGQHLSPISRKNTQALLIAATTFDRSFFPNFQSLPYAENEIASISKLYSRPNILLGPIATKKNFIGRLRGKSILHFSGHSVFNAQHPELSYFVLAPSHDPADTGLLLLREINPKDVRTLRLVVLSACQSLGPKNTRIGGISGLARIFLAAGADAVIGSLRDVPDRASAQFSRAFHYEYLATGKVGTSLQAAQIKMLNSPDESIANPASWGAYEAIVAANTNI